MSGRLRVMQAIAHPAGTVAGVETHVDYWNNQSTSSNSVFYSPADSPGYKDACWDQTNRRPYLGGGPLRIEHTTLNSSATGISASRYSGGILTTYEGSAVGRVYAPMYNRRQESGIYSDLPDPADLLSAAARGPEAWNRFRPGKPLMSLGVSLGELRDLPKSVAQLRNGVRFLRNMGRNTPRQKLDQAASQYLGYQFGWKQMASDLKGLFLIQQSTDAYYDMLQRTSGTWVNRGGTLEEEEQETYSITGDDYIPCDPLLWSVRLPYPCTSTYSQGTQTRIWFKGRFKYYVPKAISLKDKARIRAKMLGLQLTPELAWNLMPWSWLIDWFTNIGDNIANLTNGAVDDLVSEYAFIMKQSRHYARTETPSVPFTIWKGPDFGHEIQNVSFSAESSVEVKTRDASTPFGFGIDPRDFTGRQLAILAALGLSR